MHCKLVLRSRICKSVRVRLAHNAVTYDQFFFNKYEAFEVPARGMHEKHGHVGDLSEMSRASSCPRYISYAVNVVDLGQTLPVFFFRSELPSSCRGNVT